MKKTISLLLALVMCLSLVACGSSPSGSAPKSEPMASSDNNENEIMIEPAFVVVDDENLKLEVTSVSCETYNKNTDMEWTGYYVNCRVTNKTSDYDINLGAAVGDAGVGPYTVAFGNQNNNTRPGKINDTFCFSASKNITGSSPETEGVEHITSLEDLLQFYARVEVRRYDSDGNYDWNPYYVEFSLSDRQNGAENDAAAAADSLYGTWEVSEIQLESSEVKTVAEMEEGLVYSWSDWRIIVSEAGDLYLQTNNTSSRGTATVSGKDITAGKNKWVLDGDKLILNAGGTKIYYEKVSDNQTFPELEKRDLVEQLCGTWDIVSGSREGSFSFTENSATAIINGVVFTADMLSVLTQENVIKIAGKASTQLISMDIAYTYENGVLSLTYSGDSLVKQ